MHNESRGLYHFLSHSTAKPLQIVDLQGLFVMLQNRKGAFSPSSPFAAGAHKAAPKGAAKSLGNLRLDKRGKLYYLPD